MAPNFMIFLRQGRLHRTIVQSKKLVTIIICLKYGTSTVLQGDHRFAVHAI